MPKGQLVPPEVEKLIASVYEEHHGKWKAPRVRAEVEFILRKSGENIPNGFPSLSKVQKVLARVRAGLRNPSKLDEPWSIFSGVAAGIEIPTDTLPFIVATWVYMKDAWGHQLTIREARWLSRLWGAIMVTEACLGPDASIDIKVENRERFLRLVCLYAALERICELVGRPQSSADLDFTLWQLVRGQEARPELRKKILPGNQSRITRTESGWIVKATKKQMTSALKTWKRLGFDIASFYKTGQNLSISFEVDNALTRRRKGKESTK